MGKRRENGSNQAILLLATLASLRIAQGLDNNQLALLSAFFEVLGDNLALLIAPAWGGPCPENDEETEG